MKECATCGRCDADDVVVCPVDGEPLTQVFAGPTVLDNRYRLEICLGRGGMGAVYRARHLALDRTYALKLIAPGIDRDDAFLERFRTEAKALGRLKHPNIVSVTDYGIDPATRLPFLVMEYLEGTPLAEYCVSGQPMDVSGALAIFEQVAAGLDHAHRLGVLHRDLKPQNILLVRGAEGRPIPKVLDFGIAHLMASPLSPTAARHDSTATTTGTHTQQASGVHLEGPLEGPQEMGSVPYMPPEVFDWHRPTAAIDIYAFGVLMYEALTGRRPFVGTRNEIMRGHVSETPPAPSSLNSYLPPEFDPVLLAPLAKNPAARPVTAAETVRRLRHAASSADRRRWRAREVPRRAVIAGAVACVLGLLAPAMWHSAPLRSLEGHSLDWRFSLATPLSPNDRILVVAIDDPTLAADSTSLASRADEFGRTASRIFDAGARAVAIDLLLPEPWSRSQAFADLVLRHHERLTLGALSAPDGLVVGPECLSGLVTAALGPRDAGRVFGFVNLPQDSDGVVRRVPWLVSDRSGDARPTWAARAAQTFDAPVTVQDDSVLVDYRVDSSLFHRLSWKDVVTMLEAEPDAFRGRLVLIGGDFAGSGDSRHVVPSPSGPRTVISGLMMQALVTNTILSGAPLRDTLQFSFIVVASLLSLGVMFVSLTSRSLLIGIGTLGIVVAALIGVGVACFLWVESVVPVAGPTLTVLCAWMVSMAVRSRLPAPPPGEGLA